MKGLSLYYAAKFFFHEMNIQKLIERTCAVTYNFFMALPPTLLFVFSLMPYISRQHLEQKILGAIQIIIHNPTSFQSISTVLTDFMRKPDYNILSFGVIMMLFFSSNGMMGLMRSFDKSQMLYRKRTGLQRRWTAIKLTVMMIGVCVAAFSVFVIQSQSAAQNTFYNNAGIKIISIAFLAFIVFITISTIYTYGPSLKHRFKFASAGSVYATVATITVSCIFFYLVTHFIHYSKLYGSIGTLIAFMVLVWLNTAIILIGYELNVNLMLAKLSHDKEHQNYELNRAFCDTELSDATAFNLYLSPALSEAEGGGL